MAIELQLVSAVAMITGEPREKQLYRGTGEARQSLGRATDDEGRPVSVVNAVVVAEPVGLLPDAVIQLPDLQMTGLKPGAAVRLDGRLTARLVGGDYAAIRATVAGELLTALGSYVEWANAAAAKSVGAKGSEPQQRAS